MTTVSTLNGPVEGDALGITLMHEHIFNLNMEIEDNLPGRWNESERLDDAVQRLNELRAYGVGTIVDLTVIGLGRYIPRLLKIAPQVELNIVVATGLYALDDIPLFFKFRGPGTLNGGPDLLRQMFVDELTSGIADTGVRASIIKCATDEAGVTPGIDRVLRAVAHAHRETGAPITTHTHAHTRRGLDQVEIFAAEGVDLGRVVIGHSGDTTDLDYLEQLIDRGAYLGMDRFGLDAWLPFDDRVDTVARLCAKGYADRMVLSHDASCFSHNIEPNTKQNLMPRWRYTHIFEHVVPALRQRGVTDQQIDLMLVANPKSILATPWR